MKVKFCPDCGERWWCIKCGYCHVCHPRYRTAGGCCREAAGRQSYTAFPGGRPPIGSSRTAPHSIFWRPEA